MFLLLLIHQLLLLFSIDARSQDHGSRLVLRNSNTLCEGHLELYHKGTWGYVGDNRWRRSTEEVACRSTHCGEPLSVDQVLMPSDGLGKVWLNEMNCNGTEAHLWECPNPGWGVSRFTKDTMRWIKCSNEIKISLDEFQCEGPVKYSIGGGNQSGYFCTENFGRDEADILCKNRGCNESSEVFATDWPEGGNYDKMTIKCPDPKRLDNLWQCASPLGPGQQCLKRAAVTCTGHKRVRLVGNSDNVCSGTLQIEDRADGSWSPVMSDKTISPDVACKHMHCGTSANYSLESSGMQLNCTDSVRISLTEDCTGSVQISVNDTMHTVCPSDWTKENAEVVCAELKCGKAISSEMHIHHHNSILDNVECLGNESSLWHCRAKHRGQNNPLSCTQRVNVSCAASIGVRLVDGPGKCGGRLEIQLGSHGSKRVDSESIQAGLPRICHLLGCGPKTRNVKEKFSPGSGDFFSLAVKCGPGADNISDCIEYNVNSPLGKGEALMLTCEEHTVVSLAGENSCSGKVGIEYGDKTYWLSGSNSTWNWNSANAVCRQLHCGEAIDFSSIPSTESMNDVWKKSYNCTPDATSLFNCSNRMADHCNSTAHVTCNGSIKVDLTEGCWGHVNVCVGGKCGGVRRDTWSKQKSATLCRNLGCGTSIASAGSPDGKSKVIVESLHTTLLTANLNQSILVLSQGRHFEPPSKSSSAYVVCSGSLKSNISDSRHKCSGNVQVEVEGQWLPVCRDAIKDVETQNTICGEMKCGQAVELLDHFGPAPDSPLVISQLQWPSSDNKASSHKVTKNKKKCALAGIRCSEWKKMELKFNQSCSGAVFLHSKGRRHAVPKTNWTANEGPRLCSHLQCGNFVTVTERKPAVALWNSSISCTGVENARSIWDCEKNTAGSSSRNNSNQLVIQCEGEPRVTLSERCRGLVRIDDLNVCSDGRKLEHAHIACMEQNCGSALFVDDVPADPGTDNFLIRCESYHDRLGKCSRLRGKCTGLMYIHCAESIELKAKDQCRGQISVSYRNEWKDVCFGDFPSQSEEELCRYLDCPGGNNSLKAKRQSSKVIPSMMLNCTAEHKDVRYCVTKDTCGKNVAAIQCYKPEPEPPAGPSLVLILLCAFIPVVVLLLVVFVRVRRMRRSKKLRDAALRPLPRTEGELDSDDEDDGKSKRFESGTFSQDRFTSEVESRAEGDAHSTSSFPYDDIDEARPLTSQGATDDASDGAASEPPEHLSQGASSDAVAYEVEDPQYGYDDVGTPAPAVVQAEVHIAAGGAPEEPSTEDYLVPGRDD